MKARRKFESFFVNKVKQLLYVYPVDKMTKDDRPFWSLPKRAPHPVIFDQNNETHQTFIQAYACLFANMHGMDIQVQGKEFLDAQLNPRSKESRLKMAAFVQN
jgi:ubiquitin-activating enzyme E1